MARRSPESIAKACSSAVAYPSSSDARKPVALPSNGVTMSISGPPDLCASGTAPAAMNSTTLMPKCSSRMVCRPTSAWPSSACISARGTLVRKHTSQSPVLLSVFSRRPSSQQSVRRDSTRCLSPASRQPPARTKRTRSEPPSQRCGAAARKRPNDRSCNAWFFSGRNCARDRTRRPPASGGARSRGSLVSAAVSQGGKTVRVRPGTRQSWSM
mmetsp:Transcript_444/g.1098  ORF Transcript_444/g.1098 Transcript_444/m.1098 type:complete len:213 (-) Transcript_444:822-1460(-)